MVSVKDVEQAITDRTILITIMHANNEVGTIQPIAEISSLASARGIVVHTDAAQSPGKIPVDVRELGVDLLTMAGHKLYAPKGVGALYVREGTPIEPLLHGAGQERAGGRGPRTFWHRGPGIGLQRAVESPRTRPGSTCGACGPEHGGLEKSLPGR